MVLTPTATDPADSVALAAIGHTTTAAYSTEFPGLRFLIIF